MMTGTVTAESKVAKYVASLREGALEETAGTESVICAEAVVASADASSMFGLIELLLKDQTQFDLIARDPQAQRDLVPRLLAVGLIGYLVFGVALSIIFSAAGVWPRLSSVALWLETGEQPLIHFAPLETWIWQPWLDGSAIALVAAFACGLLGANGICLPSFYFYNLLSGVRTSLLQVTVIALKGMAAGAIAVVGALPIYFAVVLGLLVLPASERLVQVVCVIGLLLPFIAGFWGTTSLYRGFVTLADTIPAECRAARACFLRRLVLAWSLCFTAVTPLMIFTLWEYFQR